MNNKSIMQMFLENSYLSGSNAEYVEGLYDQYLEDASQLEPSWRDFFANLAASAESGADISHTRIRAAFREMAQRPAGFVAPSAAGGNQSAVNKFIDSYRRYGYRSAAIDPLKFSASEQDSRLSAAYHGLSQSDLADNFLTDGVLPQATASLQQIEDRLTELYAGSIGFDCAHVANEEEQSWLRHQIEHVLPSQPLPAEVRSRAMHKLVDTDTLERYLGKKYVAQKRFSVEGTDSLVPMVDRLINLSAQSEVKEIIFGMAHRGRVNVLLNNLGMSPSILYEDFVGPETFGETTGDLKYHRGFSNDIQTEHGEIHLSLMFNPSHLEYVNTVILGSVRARQSRHPGPQQHDYALPIIMHGDAAFSGEGVVMEALSMSQLRGYKVGGAIHIVVNNQIGFTTCDTEDSRSSYSCTDVAKIIDAPVFHVNADDVDAVIRVAQLAFAYRMQFHKDVVIDIMGYRRHGHQEADEPTATAPLFYKSIAAHPRSVKLYGDHLVAAGVITKEQIQEWESDCRDKLDRAEPLVTSIEHGLSKEYQDIWGQFVGKKWRQDCATSVSRDLFESLATTVFTVPDGFVLQKQVGMMVASRLKMAVGEQSMDWGFAETMAYATLLHEGYSVRLCGQDSRRGTFSHRHSSLFDQQTGEEFVGLRNIAQDPKQISIFDSPLNEAGALGFEYGYSVAEPRKLVMWEAQFGDFYNPAQVVVDQFISSGWQKWRRLSGLVLLLPHGCEGAGPEHSSARLERFLQLGAQQNIQIFVPSTPAQIFHLLRRQVIRKYRRPLVVMTPKSLLRHRMAVSSLEDVTEKSLQLVIPEVDDLDTQAIERVVLCCGKVYFDLLAERREREEKRIVIIRVEQLYPFPYRELQEQLEKYAHVKQVVWCQEEPKNQGAWFVTRHRLIECMQPNQELAYAGRKPFAAPASGFIGLHKIQQKELVDNAIDLQSDIFGPPKINDEE